ncbi:hypothetical protein FHN55_09060 [Streptomyces sp. NP160]|uniref:hypothetical protein n=1 Tax=Streptomyces sp. NP160 TaxID=2586637 RepID=UPI0011185ED8|nr:hypothetical protein [Streptomyces sp. NP160]TNM67596.1 hypothetical protein FHN55_09060 [Streptomyces sp. NP160]
MNVADTLGDLTGQLAQLYVQRGPTVANDLDVDAALHARSAVIALTRELLFWGTRLRQGTRPTLVDAETRPAHGLAWHLTRHPVPEATRSPMDVARLAAPGSAAERWERVATQATLVQTQWEASPSKPMGPAVRTVVADATVLALSVSHLDQRLATTAAASGRPDVAEALTSQAVHGLRTSAEATLRHLARGDLPAWRADIALPARRLDVLPMRSPADLPRGLARLMSLLDAGTHVSPAHLHLVLRGQERIASALGKECATLWRATADPAIFDAGRRLTELRLSLQGAAPALRKDIGSIEPADPRALLQVNECLRALGFSLPEARRGLPQRVDLAVDQTSTLLYSVEAVGSCARSQVNGRRWLTAEWNRDETAQTWHRADRHDHSRIGPLLILGETALDLLTRPAALMTHAAQQPAMAQTASRGHVMA